MDRGEIGSLPLPTNCVVWDARTPLRLSTGSTNPSARPTSEWRKEAKRRARSNARPTSFLARLRRLLHL